MFILLYVNFPNVAYWGHFTYIDVVFSFSQSSRNLL